jgi:hypothetical protein
VAHRYRVGSCQDRPRERTLWAVRGWLTILLATVGCAEESARVDLCELGEQVYSDALASLHRDPARCTRDEDCVHIRTDVECNGFSVSLCGDIVHRSDVPRWDPERVCEPLEAYPPAELSCSIQANCSGGTPVCEQGQCTARRERELDAGTQRDAQTDAR